jgi:hypothetical protein
MFGLPKEIAGTIVAAVIAAVISLLGLIISKENKVSEFRQAWIDALREEISAIITHPIAIYAAYVAKFPDQSTLWQNVRADYVGLNEAWAKVRLRLNPEEESSIAVLRALEEQESLFPKDNSKPDFQKLASNHRKLLDCTRVVLKEEWRIVKRGELVYRVATISAGLLFIGGLAGLLVIGGLNVLLKPDSGKNNQLPSLQETVDYMQRALASHNGQRIQQPPLSPEVKLVNRLTADHCKLNYELSQFDVVQFDLGDIDTKTVTVKQIGNTWWAVFKTRNFNKSVQYKHPKDPSLDYNAENGGFSLDDEQIANSFAKAVTHAAEVCGSGPSSF